MNQQIDFETGLHMIQYNHDLEEGMSCAKSTEPKTTNAYAYFNSS